MRFLYCFFAIYFAAIICFTFYQNKSITNFAKIEYLFKDAALDSICISTIPSNNRYHKFLFVHQGEIYTINKGSIQPDVSSHHLNEVTKRKVLHDFRYHSNILHSKGIVGSCLSVDSTIMLRVNNFDTKELECTDTMKIFKNYQYIYVTTKDIRLSFVHHEYYSDLFYRKPFYFYYSNK